MTGRQLRPPLPKRTRVTPGTEIGGTPSASREQAPLQRKLRCQKTLTAEQDAITILRVLAAVETGDSTSTTGCRPIGASPLQQMRMGLLRGTDRCGSFRVTACLDYGRVADRGRLG
jgi:hypothetical protein